MDWPRHSPLFPSAGDLTESTPFSDDQFSLDQSIFSTPYTDSSDLFLDSLARRTSAALDPLLSPPLPTLEPRLCVWPAIGTPYSPSLCLGSSPPSPTASTSSASSLSSSSVTSSSQDRSTDSSSSSFRPTLLPPTAAPAASASVSRSTTAHLSKPSIPASLAVSPCLLRVLHRVSADPLGSTAAADADGDAAASESNSSKRRRVVGMTAQQRAELKRQKHREIDANRIQREKAAVSRLTRLTSQQQQRIQQDSIEQEEEEAAEVEDTEQGATGGGRRDKVTVLEDSARKIEELQRLVSRLTDACTAQQTNNRTLVLQLQAASQQPPTPSHSSTSHTTAASSHPLSLLPASVTQQLEQHIGSASLHSAWFSNSTVSICVVRCSTGCVLDLNDRMLRESGWSRNHVIGRLMVPPFDYIVSPGSFTEKSFRELNSQRPLIDGPDGRMVPAKTQPQYARSKALIHQLYTGEKESIFCVFRYQLRNGRVYEVKCAVWTSSWVEEKDSDGVVHRRPDSTFMVSSYNDSVCMDDDDPSYNTS